jgi:hypothetical protein
MRWKPAIFAGLIGAVLALGACSKETQNKTQAAAQSASKDVQAAAAVASEKASEAASKAGAAIDRFGNQVDKKRKEEAAESHSASPTASDTD